MNCYCPSRLLANLVVLVDLPNQSPGRSAAHPPLSASDAHSNISYYTQHTGEYLNSLILNLEYVVHTT
jgi:hypothetical protein